MSATEQQPRVTTGQPAKDFDAERQARSRRRQLEFTAGGETFHVKPFVSPEQMDAFRVLPDGAESAATGVQVYDHYIKNMVVEEDAPLWDKVRKEADPPLSLADIEEIAHWLIEVATGRPTERPSSSGRGPSPSTGMSREASRLRTT